MRRKIAVFTGSRADYGLLFWTIKELDFDPEFELQLIVGGNHLSMEFGETWRDIKADGFDISSKVEMIISGDSSVAIIKSMGLGLIGLGDVFDQNRPDLLILLGDRFEAMVAAQAAMIHRIPIAHIHGGEATEGLIDEAIRHSITKMAHLHFVSAEDFKKRVIQLGENPDNVWNVGATGLDNIDQVPILTKNDLEKDLNFKITHPLFLITYHPVTLEEKDSGQSLERLINCLEKFNGTLVITGSNSDTGGNSVRKVSKDFARSRDLDVIYVETLGVQRYLSLMSYCDVVVGNSSSGLLEAPSIGVPTVDIGERQSGRLRAPSVIHCEDNTIAINVALEMALTDKYKKIALKKETPYGKPGAAKRIKKVINNVKYDNLIKKSFYDIEIIS